MRTKLKALKLVANRQPCKRTMSTVECRHHANQKRGHMKIISLSITRKGLMWFMIALYIKWRRWRSELSTKWNTIPFVGLSTNISWTVVLTLRRRYVATPKERCKVAIKFSRRIMIKLLTVQYQMMSKPIEY